jgi:hypothetical protein
MSGMFFRTIRLLLGKMEKFGEGTGRFWESPEFFPVVTEFFPNNDSSFFREKDRKPCDIGNMFLVFNSGYFSGGSFCDVTCLPYFMVYNIHRV